MPITITGVSSTSRELRNDVNKEAEKALRIRALQALAAVKLGTPVDTGRARNSWYIGYSAVYKNQRSPGVEILAPKNKPTEIIVTNGTDYIQLLNDGTSIQAPTRFIEQAFLTYFDDVRVIVS